VNVGDIVYWDSFGLEKPLLILEIEESIEHWEWAKVVVLTTGQKLEFCIGNLRTREQMQGW
jgi:hypothetical protein